MFPSLQFCDTFYFPLFYFITNRYTKNNKSEDKMNLGKNIVLMLLLFAGILQAQEERIVLVEIFTNSHCPLCPPAHNVIENYLTGPNGDKISYIFYHMIYPYSDDSLYWQSMESSDARDNFYNPVHATPQGWFDGVLQSSWSGWSASLDNLVANESPLVIDLSGTRNSSQFNINAQLMRTGDIPDNDLVIHFVVVEDLFFDGRNTISNHKQVMRKMLPSPSGKSFSINLNETISIVQSIDIESTWAADSLGIVVFVQSAGSKNVYQSETIKYSDLVVSNDDNLNQIPEEFILEQNYPNPFNPSSTIKFSIPTSEFVTLKVFDILGNEVAALVNENKLSGTYEVLFSAARLSSGVYFYQLKTGEFLQTKKMILMK
jgi:hypothetical protein